MNQITCLDRQSLRSSIKERTQLHAKEWTVVNGLVHFGVQQQITPAQRRTAFAAIASARMTAKPEVVVAFHAQLK